METLWQDLRYGFRMLARNPGFTAVAVLTLALGIGANTAIFTVLNAVVLRSLPYRAPDRLAVIWVDFGEHGQSLPLVSSQDFRDYPQMSQLFEDFAAASGRTANLTGVGDPEQVDVGRVTPNFIPLLGVEPALGREFLPGEDVNNGPAIVILSHGLWERRFGGDPEVIGQTIQLNGTANEVVGVMPADFKLLLPPETFLLKDPDLWVPLQDPYTAPRNRTLFTVFGRLKAGVTFEQAQAEMNSIAARLREEHLIHKMSDIRIRAVPLHRDIVKNVRPALLILFGAVGLVLLIACGNVANLLLARATAREGEIAIRVALGAGRSRIVRQILTESALLSVAGGVVGLLLALWGLDLLISLQPTHLPRLENIRIDGSALGFTVAVCFLTVLLFGLAPAIQVSRPRLNTILKEGGRSQVTGGRQAVRRGLIVSEVALSLVLLIGVGLLMRSFLSLQNVRPGFDPENILTFRLSLPRVRYPSPEERANFYHQLQERFRALPGVQSVGAVSKLPLTGTGSLAPYAYNEETEQNWESVTADWRPVTPSFFETIGSRLQAGRLFDQRDTADSRLVIIIDEMLARKAWPNENPVGKQLMLPVFGKFGLTREWIDVIGVVEHIRNHDLSKDVREQIYAPHRQRSSRAMDMVVRAAGDPTALANLLRQEVHAMDKDLPVHNLRPLTDYVSDAMAQARFTLILIGIFGAIALLLTSVGLYGVVSYAVSQRTHEIGIRMALGAQPRDILKLVVGQGMALTLVGVGVGLAGAFALTRFLESLLFGVSATDPATFAGVALLLAAVALLACYVPARRATRVEPLVALRYE